MQIPTGDNFGNRLPQLRQTNIARGSTGAASIASSLTVIGDMFSKIKSNKEAITKLDLSNQLDKRNQQLDELMDNWQLKIQTGEMSEEGLQKEYEKTLNDLKRPNFNGLNEYDQKQMTAIWDQSDYQLKRKVAGLHKNIQINSGANQLNQQFISLRQEAMKPDVDPQLIKQKLELEETNKVGGLVFDDKWQQQKTEELRQIDLSYIQGQINLGSANKDLAKLKTLKEQMLDAEQFKGVDAFERNKFISQIDSQVNVQRGTSYANAMTKGLTQLVTKTNDTQTAGVYLGVARQTNTGLSVYAMQPENIENFAKANNKDFDAKRYAEDKGYREELGQQYFISSLNQYGSPILAATVYLVGDKQLDHWLKEYGDPRTQQLSDKEFVEKIPDGEVRNKLQDTLKQADKGLDTKVMTEAVDNDPSLNKEQKIYAKREIKLTCDVIADQQNTAYLANLNKQWCELYVNNKTIADLSPQELSQVRARDRHILNIRPPKQGEYDESVYSEARARVKMDRGDNIIRDYGYKLPVEKIMELIALQQQLKNDPEWQKQLKDNFKVVEDIYKEKSTFHGLNEPVKLYDIVSEEMRFRKNQGKPMSPSEIRVFTRRQLLEVKIADSGLIWNDSKYLYQTTSDERTKAYVKDLKQIPTDLMRTIEEGLRDRGIPVTEESVLAGFNELVKVKETATNQVEKDDKSKATRN